MIGLADPLPAPVNQLDGSPNQNDNCGPAALSWALLALLGVRVSPTSLLNAAYGTGYTGLTAIDQFRTIAGAYGLAIADMGASLDAVKGELVQGRPVIVAIGSDWGDTPPTSPNDHFVCIAQGSGGNLLAANSWGGFWQNEPEGWWASRFRLGTVWGLSAQEGEHSVWTIERDASGAVTSAHDGQGHTVGAGFAWELTQHPAWEASDAIIGESYYASGQCVCALQNGAWMDWTHTAPTVVNTHDDGGAIVAQLYQLTASAAARIQQLQQELAACQASGGNGDAGAAIAALAKALADVKAS